MKRLNWILAVSLLAVLGLLTTGVVFLHGFQQERNAKNWYDDAVTLHAEKKYGEADKSLSRYINLRDDDLEAKEFLVKIRKARFEAEPSRGSFSAYLKSLNKALEKIDNKPELRRDYVKMLLLSRDVTQAETQINLLEQKKQLNSEDLLYKAEILRLKGNILGSGEIFAQLVGLDLKTGEFNAEVSAAWKDKPEVYLQLARIIAKEKSDDALAEKVINELQTRHGKDAKALYQAYQYWLYSGKAEGMTKARELAQAGHALDPDNVDFLFAKVQWLLQDRKMEEAESLARAIREKAPENINAYALHAELLYRQNKRDSANIVITEGLKREPENLQLLEMQLNLMLLPPANLKEARAIMGTIRKVSSVGLDRLQLFEGTLLGMEGKWPEARDTLLAARKKLSNPVDLNRADLWIARSYERLGELDLAKKYYEQAKNGDPNNIETRLALAALYLRAGKLSSAREEYEIVAANTNKEFLYRHPQLWRPLLDMRVSDQLEKPAEQRDWTLVDKMVEEIEAQPDDIVNQQDKLAIRSAIMSRQGKQDTALSSIRQARDANPQNVALWSTWVDVASRTSEPNEILKELQTAPPEVQTSLPMVQIQAFLYTRLGGDEALTGMRGLLEKAAKLKNDEGILVYMFVAENLQRIGKRDDAKQVILEAKGKYPNDLRPYNALLSIARDESDVASMEKMAEEVRKIAGNNSTSDLSVQAQIILTTLRRDLKARMTPEQTTMPPLTDAEKAQLDKAQVLAEKLAKMRPEWQEPNKLLADIAGFNNDATTMIAQLQQSARKGDLDYNRTRQLTTLLISTGRVDEADEILERMTGRLDGTLQKIQFEIHLRKNRLDQAQALLEKMRPAEDASLADQLWYGQSLLRIKQPSQATDILRIVVNRDPSLLEGWFLLVNSLLQENKKAEIPALIEEIRSKAPAETRDLIAAQCAERAELPLDQIQEMYATAIANQPDNLSLRRQLVGYYVRSKNNATAIAELDKIVAKLAQQPDSKEKTDLQEWARRSRVVALVSQGDIDYQKFLETEKSLAVGDDKSLPLPDLLLRIALLAGREEPIHMRQAIRLFEELASRQPLATVELLTLAKLQSRVGNQDRARELMLELLSKPNPEPTWSLQFAEMLVQSEKYREAEPYLNKFIESYTDPAQRDAARKHPLAVSLKATILVKTKRETLGADYVVESLGTRPLRVSEAPRLKLAARLLEDLEQINAAEALYKEFADMNDEGKILQGRFIARYRDFDQGMKQLDELAANPALTPMVIVQAINVLRYRQAEMTRDKLEPYYQMLAKWYRNFSEGKEQTPQVMAVLAEIREIRGELNEAAELYRQLINLKSDAVTEQTRAVMKNNLAYVLTIQGKPENLTEAKKVINEAIDYMGPQSDLMDTQGTVDLFAGDLDAAKAKFQDAVLQPSGVKYYHLAVTHFKLGEIPAAKAALSQAMNFNFKARDMHAAERTMYNEMILGLKAADNQQASRQ
ncbi:MAG: hypothetical protein SFX18_18595 [Pirellulales bacterium]|nr:hypothetical protein [Pirellulales bacterium]